MDVPRKTAPARWWNSEDREDFATENVELGVRVEDGAAYFEGLRDGRELSIELGDLLAALGGSLQR